VWPLLTFTLSPADGSDRLVWAMFALAGVSGFLIPLCEPYPYIPYDPTAPQSQTNPQQTASLLSFVTFSYLDPVVFASTRVDHLAADMLPPLDDTDGLAALKPKAYQFLDPFHRAELREGKPRHVTVFWGLLASFRYSWTSEALLYAIGPALRLGAPIGTNRLLTYLETNGANAVVRPWVWIAWIALAPFATDVVSQLNLWIMARVMCQIEALFTALVYDHALRVRIIHRPDNAPDSDAREAGLEEPVIGAVVPGIVAASQSAASGPDGATDTVDTHSRTESSATSATAVSSVSGSPSGKASKKADKKADTQKEKATEKAQDLVGRLNNLVTSGEFVMPYNGARSPNTFLLRFGEHRFGRSVARCVCGNPVRNFCSGVASG
jgi:hypothetical protein